MVVMDLVEPIAIWLRDNIKLEDALQALGIAISVVIIPALWGIATAITGILGPFGLLVLGIRIFKEAWEKDLLGIRTTATQVFEETIKPLLSDIATFIEQKIVPAIQDLGKWLGGIWESVRPTLQMLHDWFVKDAVPAIVDVIKNSLLPFIDEIGVTLGNIWKIVEPALSRLFEWFVKDALPAILSFISEKVIPAVGVFIDILRTIWDIVGPGLEKFVNYLVETGFPAVGVIINTIIDVIKLLIATIKAIWSEVSPALETFGEGIGRLLQPVIDYYTWLFNIVSDVVKKLREFNAINVGQAAAVIEQGPAAILDPKQFDVGGYTGNAPGVAGVVHGREYVVPEQGALVVRGEGGGAGGANIENLIVQYNGIPQSQQEADSGVRFMVNALESEGVILS